MRESVVRIVLVLFGCTLALLVAEVGARFLPPPPSLTVRESTTDQSAVKPVQTLRLKARVDEGDSLLIQTPTGKRMRPNFRAIIENEELCHCRIELTTNSLGFRNPPINSKMPEVDRVLFLGDSITLASYVPEKRTWVRQVEQLSRRNGGSIEAINAGIWAVGLANELSLLTERGLSAQPDKVVLGFYLNDFEASPGVEIFETPDLLQWSSLARLLFFRMSFLRSYRSSRDFSLISHEEIQEWKRQIERDFSPTDSTHQYRSEPGSFYRLVSDLVFDFGGAWSEGAWQRMEPLIEEFSALSKAHRFEPYIVMFPVEYQVGAEFIADYPQKRMQAIARRLGIPMLDLLPVLRKAKRESGVQLFYDWCHHTPAGQDIIAQAVFEFLTG